MGTATAPAATKPPTLPERAATLAVELRNLILHGQVVELRVLKYKEGNYQPHTVSGFFDSDHLTDLAAMALRLTGNAKGVYFTLNPVAPDLLARRCNRTGRAEDGELTNDGNIIRRQWLLIDVDPVRDSFISATDAEKHAALGKAQTVRTWLREQSWPEPIIDDSGNGWHLLYRIDLPRDDGGLVERCLKALAARFDDQQVKIDQKVFNPSRICKLPGTIARKGDNTKERPHRPVRMHLVPDGGPIVVSTDRLEALAKQALEGTGPGTSKPAPGPSSAPSNGNGTTYHSRLLVAEWLIERGAGFRVKPQADGKGRTVYVLKECPFNGSHGDPDSCIMQAADGQMSAQCFHNSCRGRGWQDLKEAIGAPNRHHYDPPLPNGKAKKKKTAPKPSANGDSQGPIDQADTEDDIGPSAYDLILAHFRAYYQPVFRRGNLIYSAILGRDVRPSEGCYAPGKDLVELLLDAWDCPQSENGPKRGSVPKLFRDWAPSAWRDLLAKLPDEHQSAEIVEPAQEQFRAELAKAMNRTYTLGFEKKDGQVVKSYSLIGWCKFLAKSGGWEGIRSLCLWTQFDSKLLQLRVAIRVELLSQVGFGGLHGMTQRKFSALCELYGCGRSVKVEGGDRRAVELEHSFIADLLAQPTNEVDSEESDGRTDAENSRTRAREETSSERPS